MAPPGFVLYLITDGVSHSDASIEAALGAVPPGAAALQLRDRSVVGRELLRRAERLRRLTSRYRAPLFVNDRLDVALAVAADGVHLPGAGLPVGPVRKLVGERLLVAAAAHQLPEARAAVRAGADLVTFGPIWPTPSKPADVSVRFPVSPVGLVALEAAAAAVAVPLFALGGVDSPERARRCAEVGARVACIRGVLGAERPAAAAAAMHAAVRAAAAAPRP